MSVRPSGLSLRMEQLCSDWMDFHEMLIFQYFFFKSVEIIQFLLKIIIITGPVRECLCTFITIRR
jgi:hypothetical protein